MKTYRVEYTDDTLDNVYKGMTGNDLTTLRVLIHLDDTKRNPRDYLNGNAIRNLTARGIISKDFHLTPFGEVLLKWMNDNGL